MIRSIRPRARLRAILPAAILAGVLAAPIAGAYTLEEFEFDTPEQSAEFRALIDELRCLVCQNESLAGSQAELAQDLRNEVYRMMKAGQTRDEIVDFLVARYGDFVLYDPPLKLSTYPLWFGPMLLAGVAGFFMMRALVKKKQAREEELSDEERARLDRLLAESGGDDAPKPGG